MNKTIKARKATMEITTGILQVNRYRQSLPNKGQAIVAGFSERTNKKLKAVASKNNPFQAHINQIDKWLAKYYNLPTLKAAKKALTKKQNSLSSICSTFYGCIKDRSHSYLHRVAKQAAAEAVYGVCQIHTNMKTGGLTATDANYTGFVHDLEGLDSEYFVTLDLEEEFAIFKEQASAFGVVLLDKDTHKDAYEGYGDYVKSCLATQVNAACDLADSLNLATEPDENGNGIYNDLINGLTRQFFDLSRGAYKDDGSVENPSDEVANK